MANATTFTLALLVLTACDQTGVAPDVGRVEDVVEDTVDVTTSAPETALETTTTTTEDVAVDSAVADVPVEVQETVDVRDVDPGPTTYELKMGGWTMEPGDETTQCVLLRLPNDKPVRVNRIRTNLGPGSHHLIVYRTPYDHQQPSPYPCSPFTEFLGGKNTPLAVSQVREETIQLPDGVAHEFAAHEVLRLEAHYLNYFPTDITADVKVWLDLVPDDQPTEKADILFYGNVYIHLPPGQAVTSYWNQIDVPVGLTVFAMTGHTHALGTGFEVQRSKSVSTPGEVVYPAVGTEFDWEEPPVAWFDPPLHFTEPGDGFRFRCHWVNTTDQTVDFGESATQEMCFFWGYYWPSQGPLIRFD